MIVCRVCGHDKLMLRTSLKKLYIQSEELGPTMQRSLTSIAVRQWAVSNQCSIVMGTGKELLPVPSGGGLFEREGLRQHSKIQIPYGTLYRERNSIHFLISKRSWVESGAAALCCCAESAASPWPMRRERRFCAPPRLLMVTSFWYTVFNSSSCRCSSHVVSLKLK